MADHAYRGRHRRPVGRLKNTFKRAKWQVLRLLGEKGKSSPAKKAERRTAARKDAFARAAAKTVTEGSDEVTPSSPVSRGHRWGGVAGRRFLAAGVIFGTVMPGAQPVVSQLTSTIQHVDGDGDHSDPAHAPRETERDVHTRMGDKRALPEDPAKPISPSGIYLGYTTLHLQSGSATVAVMGAPASGSTAARGELANAFADTPGRLTGVAIDVPGPGRDSSPAPTGQQL